jgi:hypothetical protein
MTKLPGGAVIDVRMTGPGLGNKGDTRDGAGIFRKWSEGCDGVVVQL